MDIVLDEDNECYYWFGIGIPCCQTSEVKKCKESWHLPWKTLQFKKDNFFDYSGIEAVEKRTGMLINMGDYPNQIEYYFSHLPVLRNIFTFKRKHSRKL